MTRGDRIRTCDFLLPKQARYRTAPRPVNNQLSSILGLFKGDNVSEFEMSRARWLRVLGGLGNQL